MMTVITLRIGSMSTRVINSGTWKDSISRVKRQIENGERCARCQILIFDSLDDATGSGISKPCRSMIDVRGGKHLCSDCAK